MNVLTGNYVTLGVGSKSKTKDFILARTVDSSDFRSGWDQLTVGDIQNQDAKYIYFNLNSSKANSSKELLKTIGIDKQYQISERVPTYKTLLDVSEDYSGDLTAYFSELPIGTMPDYFYEETLKGHIFTTTDPNDYGKYRVNTSFIFDSETQYYLGTEFGDWYYINDASGSAHPNSLKFYYGRGPLSADGGRMSECVLSSFTDSNSHYGWWTFETWDGEHDRYETVQLAPSAWGSGTTERRIVNAMSQVTNFTGLKDGYRNLNSQFTYYISQWKTGMSEADKTTWKNLCRETLQIQNVTISQFGRFTHDGHEYFGIWVIEPVRANYLGYNAVTQNNPVYEGDNPDDLRRCGNFTDAASRDWTSLNSATFYGIELSKLNIKLDLKDGTAPPTINDNPNEAIEWPRLNPVLLNGRSMGTLAKSNEHGFHIWAIFDDRFKSLIGQLWNWSEIPANVLESFNSDNGTFNPLSLLNPMWTITKGVIEAGMESRLDPLSAIMFARKLPDYVGDQAVGEHDYGEIKICGIGTEIYGYCCNSEVYATEVDIDCSGLRTTGSYLDLSPWSSAEIYIPYIGVIKMDPTDFVGGSIKIRFNVCPMNGAISAHIVCWNDTLSGDPYPTEYGPYVGNCAFEIPLSVKDSNAFQRELGYMKAIGTGLTGVAATIGNSMRTLMSNPSQQDIMRTGMQNVGIQAGASVLMAKQAVDAFTMKQGFHGTEIGTGSSIVCPTNEIYIIYSTPLPIHENFKDSRLRGLTSGKISSVAAAKGADGKEFVKFAHINLNKDELAGATEDELNAIRTYLLGGVYL